MIGAGARHGRGAARSPLAVLFVVNLFTMAILAAPCVANAQAVTKQNDLSFGTIFTGTTTSIAVTDAGAARWVVTSPTSLLNQITFALPANLSTAGGQTIALTYCSTCAGHNTSNNAAGSTKFNPATGATVVLAILSSTVYIWLGASVSPPLNQPAGSYSATVVVTFATVL